MKSHRVENVSKIVDRQDLINHISTSREFNVQIAKKQNPNCQYNTYHVSCAKHDHNGTWQ